MVGTALGGRSEGGPAVLGDLFPMCGTLAVPVRLRLASRLAVPGRPPALLIDDLLALPLPADAVDRSEVVGVIAAGLDRPALTQLADERLRDLVPALEGRGGPVEAAGPPRLRALLERHGAVTWPSLSGLTLGEIAGWSGVGASTLAAIVGAALDVAADVLGGLPAHPPDHRLAAFDRLLDAAGDVSDRGVFGYRSLRLADPATLGELAGVLHLTQERVRQLRVRAEDRVRSVLATDPSLLPSVTTVADELGSAAPAAAVEGLLTSLDLAPLPDSRSLLALWLAGPYRPVSERPGWLAVEPDVLLAETSRMLREDGGVRDAGHVAKELEALGIPPEHCAAWLADQPVRLLDGLVISTSGADLDVAERALSASGRAMTVDELSAWSQVGVRRLWTLLGRDRRFLRVAADAFELTEWGGAAYGDGNGDGRLLLRIVVDAEVLAGSAAPVPLEIVHRLGMGDGERRSFASRYGPVALSCSRDGAASCASLRPVVLASGAGTGDLIVLGFHPDDDRAMVEVVASATATATTE